MLGKELLTQEDFAAAARFLDEHPECEMQVIDGKHIIVEKDLKPEIQAQLKEMEAATGLTREIREIILANDLKVSDFVGEKFAKMEQLAEELREPKHSWEK